LAAYCYLPLRVDAMDLKNRLCMSRPMTVTASIWCPLAPANREPLARAPIRWDTSAGGGAVHNINCGQAAGSRSSGDRAIAHDIGDQFDLSQAWLCLLAISGKRQLVAENQNAAKRLFQRDNQASRERGQKRILPSRRAGLGSSQSPFRHDREQRCHTVL